MIALRRLAGLRNLTRHPLQSALCVLGIALGVALVLAIDMAIASSEEAFLLSSRAVRGEASHRIVGPPRGIPEDLYRRLRVQEGIRRIAPVLEGQAVLVKGERRSPFRLIGVDPYAELTFRPDFAAAGQGTNLLAEGRSVLLEKETAAGLGLEPGDRFSLEVTGRVFEIALGGVIELEDSGRRKLAAQVMVADIAIAQELFDRIGRLGRIDVLPPEEDAEAWLDRLETLLPGDHRLEETPAENVQLDDMLAAFRLNLSFLSLLALVVATFLIYGTISFSVVQRREMLGRLRAFGVSGKRMGRDLIQESLVLGIPGTLLGVLLGILLGRVLVDVVSATINDHYFVVSVREVSIPLGSVAKATFAGIVATLLSAWWPARTAARTPPRALMLRSELEGRLQGGAGKQQIFAALALFGALLLALWPVRDIRPAYGVIVLLIAGFAALAPTALRIAAFVFAPIGRALFGTAGLLAARGLVGGLSRNSVATASLAMALALALGVSVMVGSFRGAVSSWLVTTLGHDVYLTLPGVMAAKASDGLFEPDEVEKMGQVEGVTRVVTNRHVDLRGPDGALEMVVLGGGLPDRPNFNFLSGDPAAIYRRFRAGEGVLVSEPLAFRRELAIGDRLELHRGNGLESLEIIGVFQDYASERGYAFAHEDLIRPLWPYEGQTAIALDVDPEIGVDAVMSALSAIPGPDRPWLVRSQKGIRETSLEIFDRTFRITKVLKLLAGLVAGIGVFSALMALQLESAWEHAVLRARGLSPRGLKTLVLSQSGLCGLVAALLALPLGLLFALVLVDLVNRRSFGWSLPLATDPWLVGEALLLGLGAALLAGVWPALAAARRRPAEVLGRGGRR